MGMMLVNIVVNKTKFIISKLNSCYKLVSIPVELVLLESDTNQCTLTAEEMRTISND